ARTENYTSLPQVSINSDSVDQFSGTQGDNTVNYNLNTPWKFILSGTYLFGGGERDTRQQKGFVTADVEYTTNSSARFHSSGEDAPDNGYFEAINSTVRNYYKGNFGARLGGEMKFDILMARAGLAYYSSPYRDGSLDANRLYVSGGLGWRNRGMFVDLTYIQ